MQTETGNYDFGTSALWGGRWRRGRDAMDIAAARRRVLWSAVAAFVALGFAAWGLVVAQPTPWLRVPRYVHFMLVPTLAACVHAVVSALLDASWPRARGDVRRARISARGIGEVVGRRLLAVHGASAVLFALLVALGAVLSRDGRTFGWGWNERSGRFLGVVTNTDFPGAHVTTPLVITVVALMASTWAAVWVTVHRPDVVSARRASDLRLRSATAGRVVRATTAALLVTDGALAALAGAAVSTAFHGSWIGLVGTSVAYAGVGVALSALVMVLPLWRR